MFMSFDLYPRRGLNPPHRVKSISMTTFTQQEIEFLQKHSNEVCKHIWLGLYDDKSSQISVNLRKSKSFFRRNMRRKDGMFPQNKPR
ncbi:arf-GAP domain and FG repeat-containing protein 1-like [Sinocyclocheilus anshuiensis]|uniref:arf-GAP domain and FG repeat-containing protein 1-like n=1 Tax=Sinocyclocheilus anshuiensis TaxID=1608454 RepID=UPI0007BA9103|nr:PREDICTED: arf-GAP domain and FG repeat-containing protein 1-like [Sinocyclocheilus anshuiensis]